MAESSERANFNLKRAVETGDLESLERALRPDLNPVGKVIPMGFSADVDEVARRRRMIGLEPASRGEERSLVAYGNNIENLVGTVELPVGVAGPLRINGLHAQGDFMVPLATHEAALVASFHRGALAITKAGGCTAMLLNEGVSRSPGFIFRDLVDTGRFLAWALPLEGRFREIAESTTGHGKLVDMHTTIEGNHVYLRFDYHTGDAAGQNMVTIATRSSRGDLCRGEPFRGQEGEQSILSTCSGEEGDL